MGLKMRADEMKRMYLAVCRTLINKEKMLCELDSYIGDGDHGTTVARGFGEAGKRLMEKEYSYPAEVAEEIGHMLEISMGGAIGPSSGKFFPGRNGQNRFYTGLGSFRILCAVYRRTDENTNAGRCERR